MTVDMIALTFDKAVSGVDLADLSLTRHGKELKPTEGEPNIYLPALSKH